MNVKKLNIENEDQKQNILYPKARLDTVKFKIEH